MTAIAEKTHENLATDQINLGKILFLTLIVFSIMILAFYATNIPEIGARAQTYWILGITSVAVWGVSKGITKVKGLDFPNPIVFEGKTMIGDMTRKKYAVLFLVSLSLGIYIFFSVASSPTLSIVAAPHFQIVEVTPEISSLFTFMASLMEDFFFWGVVLALIYGVVYILSRSYYISLGVAGIGTPLTFMLFHTLVYGTTNVPASTGVFFFGVMMTLAVITTRNLTFPIIVHGMNNVALNLFESTGGLEGIQWLGYTIILILLVTSLWIWFRWRK